MNESIDFGSSHLVLSNLFQRNQKSTYGQGEPLMIHELNEDQLRTEAYKCGIKPDIELDKLRDILHRYHKGEYISDAYKLNGKSFLYKEAYTKTNITIGCLSCFSMIGWVMWLLK